MATPMNADLLVRVLRSAGLRVVEHRSWRTNNRNSKGAWGPVHGVMIHHTVTQGTYSSVNLCYDGHSSLPGPLCHGVIDKDGTVYLVGNGRANHAGLGDPDVLRAVRDETVLPLDNQASVDGNAHFYGFECVNLGDGKDPWPAAQLEAIAKASAAICQEHGWSQRSVIGHLEWQPGKIDPRGFSMGWLRQEVSDRLDSEGDDVALTDDDKNWLTGTIRAVVKAEVGRAVAAWKNTDIDPRDVYQVQRDAANYAKEAADLLKTMPETGLTAAQIDSLAKEILDRMSGRLAE